MFSKLPRWLLGTVKVENYFPKGSHPVYGQTICMLIALVLESQRAPLPYDPDSSSASAKRSSSHLKCFR